MPKRFFDLIVASTALLVLALPLIGLAAVVRARLGSPVFFVQNRAGLDGKAFKIFKFRTMLESTDHTGKLLSDGERLTPFGRWLRETSLDELPELWNVIKGEMSIVGPRPLLVEYLPLYSHEQLRRHEVLPGITGWAQVNGRNSISWEKKFALDIWYVKNNSFCLDMKILWMTLVKGLLRDGISADGDATMPRFKGSKREDTKS